MLIVTTHNIPFFTIIENKGVINSNQVLGANFFSEFVAGFNDVFGGTSGAYRNKLDILFEDIKAQLSVKASEIGANAIIGLKIDFDEISGKGKSMFMVTCIGTAVVVKPNLVEKYEKLHKIKTFLDDKIITFEQYEEELMNIERCYNFQEVKAVEPQVVVEQNDLVESDIEVPEDDFSESIGNKDLYLDRGLLISVAASFDDLWMMSHDGIEKAEIPNFLRGETLQERLAILIANRDFDIAAKVYSRTMGVTTELAYDYICSFCFLAKEQINKNLQ